MRQFFRVGLFLAVLLALSSGVGAQGNLLQNPSFEAAGNYNVILASAAEGTVFGVPASWDGWIATTPRTETWMNLVPDGYPHTGLYKFDGGRSLSISRGFASFTTAVFQRVTVAAGTNVRGSARGFMERGTNPPPGAQFRVGIDPTGGSNPLNPAVVWSPWVSSSNGWVQATVEATSASGAVTLFLYSTQSSPSNPNAIYWDDAVLEVGGAGATASGTPGSANVLPTPAFAPFVQPQGVQPDGSIVHTVVEGDTLDAIAVAYGTTRDAIVELNDMPSRAFLMIGQKIIVQPPGTFPTTGTPSAGSTMTAGTSVAAATGTLVTATPANLLVTSTPAVASSPSPRAGSETPEVAQASTEVSPTDAVTTEPTVEATETPEVAQASTEVSPTDAVTTEPTVEATETPQPTATETPTEESSPTDLPPAPVTQVAQVPQPSPDVTALCVWMFNDANQNRIQEGGETVLSGGQIEIKQGSEIIELFTTESAQTCFYDITSGDYTASGIAPDGFGLTTATVLNLRVQENALTNVRFGAAEGVASVIPPTEVAQLSTPIPVQPVDEQAASDSLLQMSGLLLVGLAGVVILGGIGLALFIRGR